MCMSAGGVEWGEHTARPWHFLPVCPVRSSGDPKFVMKEARDAGPCGGSQEWRDEPRFAHLSICPACSEDWHTLGSESSPSTRPHGPGPETLSGPQKH